MEVCLQDGDDSTTMKTRLQAASDLVEGETGVVREISFRSRVQFTIAPQPRERREIVARRAFEEA